MEIRLAATEAEIARCHPVMVQLRPHLALPDFVAQVQRQQAADYHLAYVEDEGAVRAVAGFRYQEMLVRGLLLYVDDLVTDGTARSHGYGGQLLDWLAEQARARGCTHLELDSGVQRFDAHRFYFRKRMHITSYHFLLALGAR